MRETPENGLWRDPMAAALSNSNWLAVLTTMRKSFEVSTVMARSQALSNSPSKATV
jgi:hypothetical protein